MPIGILFLCACGTTSGSGEDSIEYGEVIASSRGAEQPETDCPNSALTDDEGFACRTLEALRRALPDAEVEEVDTETLRIRIGDQELGVALERTREQVRALSATDREREFARWIEASATGLQVAAAERPQLDPARLRVSLKPRTWIDARSEPLVWRPFLGELVEVLVDDQPTTMRFAQEHDLDSLGMSADEAFSRGRRNLAEASSPLRCEPDAVCTLHSQDGYAAARVLTPDGFADVAATFGGSFLVAIPSRDHLFAAPEELADELRALAEEAMREASVPLSPVFLTYRDGAFVIGTGAH